MNTTFEAELGIFREIGLFETTADDKLLHLDGIPEINGETSAIEALENYF